ncbi:hypothetical protein EON65_02040 [archaeon]|nr:MAG: hypothetical protein EON65_02040 [archaeon]
MITSTIHLIMRYPRVIALLVIVVSFCQLTLGFLDIFKKPIVHEPPKVEHHVDSVGSKIRGVAPHLSSRYEQEKFACDGGKVILNHSSINDDYCDCHDGSDEPGTSACSNGVYYCLNSGYKVTKITSSRVDDGICDCCDGSDEGKVTQCSNTCKQQAERERAQLEQTWSSYRKGSAVRKQLIQSMVDKKSTLSTQLQTNQAKAAQLDREVSDVQGQLDRKLEEVKAHVGGEALQAASRLEMLLGLDNANLDYAASLLGSLLSALDVDSEKVARLGDVPSHLPSPHDDPDYNPEFDEEADDSYGDGAKSANHNDCLLSSISHTLSPLCAWEGDDGQLLAKTKQTLQKVMREFKPFTEAMLILGHYKLSGSLEGASDFVRAYLGESGGADTCPPSFESLPHHCLVKEMFRDPVELINDMDSVVENDLDVQSLRFRLSEAQRIQSDASMSVNNAQRELGEIERYNDHLEILAMKDQCFEAIDGKFSYTLCVMGDVRQKELEGGHNTVNLGSFNRIEENEDNGYTMKMLFTDGQYCHAFGARKAEAKVECGGENKLKGASEPSTCSYALAFESPLACTDKYAVAHGIPLQ